MLFKNVVKTLRKKWMQLLAIGIIIILSSCTYTMMFYALSGIEKPTTEFLREYNQEDFSVEMLNMATTEEAQNPSIIKMLSRGFYSLSDIKKLEPGTFYDLIDDRIKKFETAYKDCSLELREFKTINYNLDGKNHKSLVIKDSKKINLSYIEEGVKPTKDNEIAVTKIYAEKNSLNIGNTILINKKPFRISGFVLFPDYTLPMFDDSYSLDTGLQTLMLMTDKEYEELDAKESFRLSGVKIKDKAVDTSYDKDMLPFVTQIASTNNSMRSGAIYSELTQGRVTALGLSIFIDSIALIIVSILIYNLLHSERGQIGLLKALGYKRLEIALPYLISVMFPAFLMLIIGYIIGSIYAEPLKKLYLDFYLLPAVKINQSIKVFATAILAPMLFFTAISGVIFYKMLGEKALELLKPHENKSINRLSRSVSRLLVKTKAATKFKYLNAIRNTYSFFIFFLGIMFSTILMSFSFMATGMVDKMTVEYLNKVDYNYESYGDFTKRIPDPRGDQEKFLVYPYAYIGDNLVTLEGLEPRNSLYNLYDEEGKNITVYIQNGAVITRRLGIKLSLEKGDTIRVKVNKDYYSFKVLGVTDEYIADRIYLSIKTLSNIVSDNKTSRLFSGIFSTLKPSDTYYSTIISKEGIIEQSKAMNNYTRFMVNIMIGGSAVIAASILFVLTSFTVEKNYYIISLLKVIGYKRREVNSMILNSYFIYTVLSYLISLPIAMLLMKIMMKIFAEEYGVVLPLELKPYDIVKGLAIMVLIFLAGTLISRRKIEKTPLQEVLKTYGE